MMKKSYTLPDTGVISNHIISDIIKDIQQWQKTDLKEIMSESMFLPDTHPFYKMIKIIDQLIGWTLIKNTENNSVEVTMSGMILFDLSYQVISSFSGIISSEQQIEFLKKLQGKYIGWDSEWYYKFLAYSAIAFSWYKINIYYNAHNLSILCPEDFDIITRDLEHKETFIVIDFSQSVNRCMWQHIEGYQSLYQLKNEYTEVLSNLSHHHYQKDKVTINFDSKWHIADIDLSGREYDLEKFRDLNDKVEFGSIGFKKHANKKQFIEVKEKKKLQ